MNTIHLINQATFQNYEDISVNIKSERLNVFIKKAQDLDLKPFLGHALYYDFIQYAGQPSGILTAGIAGLTTAGDNTYVNTPLTKITGNGTGAYATIVVSNGVATAITFNTATSGQNFAIGDTLNAAAVPGATFMVTALDPNSTVGLLSNTPQNYINLFNGCEYQDRYGHNVDYEGLIPTLVYFTFARFIEADAVHYTATGPVLKHHDNADAVAPKDIVKLVQQQRSVANAHANEVEKFLWDNKADFPLWNYNGKNKSSRQSGPRIRGIDRTGFNLPSGYDPAGADSYLPITGFMN